jgi:toxin ParE1/3/4
MIPDILRGRSRQDAFFILDHYLMTAGAEVALSFIAALEAGIRHVVDHPSSGSPRLGQKLKKGRLRVWPIRGFPHLIVYTDMGKAVDIIRIIHGARDVPARLRDGG